MTEISSAEKEKYTKHLKRQMDGWREMIIPINSILLWERSWHPGFLFGLSSIIFLSIWILEPAVLTLISISLLMGALIDYFVFTISPSFFSTNSWTGQKERKLDEICQNLSVTILGLQSTWKSLLQMRNNRPNFYYGSLITILLFISWIGNTINNLFLFYIIVTILLLSPGLKHEHRAQSVIKSIYNQILHRKTS